MCGIFGYIGFNSTRLSDELLRSMGKAINHRGPDAQGIWCPKDKNVALGNQRLSIIDIENGNQPFISKNNDIVVVQNGEIFNHVEIAESLKGTLWECQTHCDTEVILRLYEKEGIDGLSKLNGMFAIAIFDLRTGDLYLFRDRVGEKPLYFLNKSDKGVFFASEIKSILEVPFYKPEINFDSLNLFMALNYVPRPFTLFNEIYHVRPGHYLHVSNGEVSEICWWDLSFVKLKEKDEDSWISEFRGILEDSVRIRLRSDVPFGAFLSGGVDSSTVVGLMSQLMDKPVNTYSIGFDDPAYDESPYALEAAQRFSTNHVAETVEPNLLDLWPLATYHSDQPHGDVSFLPTYKVAELASRDVRMVLTGDGADELYAGYDKYKSLTNTCSLEKADDSTFSSAVLKSMYLFNAESRDLLLSDSVKNKLNEEFSPQCIVNSELSRSKHLGRINQMLFVDTELLLSGNNLVKPDRMGMAVSIENRAPFMDYRLIEHAFSMPGDLKLVNGETKYIYKKAVASMIGDNLAYRRKQMFTVPVGEWFKTDLKPLCEDLLLSTRSKNRRLFNYDYVSLMLDDHCSGRANYTREIRALMAFEYWCREFLDCKSSSVG